MSVLDFQHKRLVRAGDLSDRHMNREVRIGRVEGVLVDFFRVGDRVRMELLVGTNRVRSVHLLDVRATVEIGRKP